MTLLKLFITVGLLFFHSLLFSQANEIIIKTQLVLEDEDCNNTATVKRSIDIQKVEGNIFTSTKKFESSKCSDVLTMPRITGKFKALVNVEKYDLSEIMFEIDNVSIDTVYVKGILYKSNKINALTEIVINTSSNNLVKTEGNKTSFSVKNNDLLNNGSVLETIKKLPGVMTDINGSITMKGKNVIVYVDGMATNMSGQDLTNYLNTISSSTVSKVEIVSNPGASYDANTASDVINVITNQKNRKGINGSIYSAITTFKKQKAENSLALNGLYNKINWNFNFGYSDIEYENGMNKMIADKSNDNSITDNYLSQNTYKPLSVKTGFSLPIQNNSIDVKYSFTKSKQNTIGISEYLGIDNSIITKQDSRGVQEMTGLRNEITTNFTHKFKKPEQSFGLNYQFYNFDRNLNSKNDSDLGSSQYQNVSKNKFTSHINKLKGDLSIPLELFKLNSGFKLNNSNIESDGLYSTIVSGSTNNFRSLQFDYKDLSVAFYSEVYKKYKNLDFTAGLRYEYINFESKIKDFGGVSEQYSNFYPSFNLGYKPSSITEINLSYSKKVKMPGYQELDPNSSGINNNLVSDGGNPLLKPSFYDNVALKINFFKYANVDFSYSLANRENYAVLIKESDNSYKQTIEPFYNVKNFSTSLGLPVPLGIFTKGLKYLNNINNLSSINYIYFFSGVNSMRYDKEGYSNNYNNLFYFGGYTQFLLPMDTKMNLQYIFSSKGNYTIYYVEKTFNKLDLTLSKSLFKDTLKIQFSVSDIFNSGNGYNVLLENNDITAHVRTQYDSQRIKFSLTYNFGSYKNEKKNFKEDVDERENKKSSIDMKF